MAKKRAKRPQTAPKPAAADTKAPGSISATSGQWIYLLLLITVTFGAFYPSLQCDFVNWDDDLYVTDNALVKNPTSENLTSLMTESSAVNYHPITMLSLAFQSKISGTESAFPFHLVNVLVHLLNVVLVFLWVRLLTKGKWLVALIAATVFALHPMHVESVTWISERKDVLFTAFFLLGLMAYTRSLHTNRPWGWLGLAFLACCTSLLSKPAAVVFPLVLILMDWFVARKWTLFSVLEKVPFFIASAVLGFVTLQIQVEEGAAEATSYSLFERIQMAGFGLTMYLVKFLAPLQLSSFYPYPAQPFPGYYVVFPLLAAAVLGAIIFFFRHQKKVLFGIGFFLINLVLVLQLVTVGSAAMADRYTYVPYIGLGLLVGWGLQWALKQKGWKWAPWAFLVIGLWWTATTFQRTKVWTNGETLWSDVIEKFPEHAGGWGGRGIHWREAGAWELAVNDFNQAIALNPVEPRYFNNRGNVFFNLGQFDQALDDYNRSLALDPTRGDKHFYANRGAIYGTRGDYPTALDNLNKALAIDSNFENGLKNRAYVLSKMDDHQGAANDYSRLVEINPQLDEIWNALGTEYQYLREFEASLVCFTNATNLRPEAGMYPYNAALSLNALGRKEDALERANKAQQLGYPVQQGFINQLRN